MTDIISKLNTEIHKDILDEMFDLITALNPEKITEEQAIIISNIIDMLDPEPIQEGFFKRRVRRDLKVARERRRNYRRNRAKLKRKARKYRRSAKGKQTLRKAKRFGKFGRTSRGIRKKTFIGPQLPKAKMG